MNTKTKKVAANVENETAQFETINLDSLNLDNLIKKSEKRKSLYKYSVELLANENYKDLQKKKRKEIRNNSKKIALAVALAIREKKSEKEVERVVNEFNLFYKENFQNTNFSFESFSQVSIKEDKDLHSLYTIVLQFVKNYNEANTITL